MTLRISFHQSAELELKEAAQYYESEVPGLGKAFVDEVEHALDQISLHPIPGDGLLWRGLTSRMECINL